MVLMFRVVFNLRGIACEGFCLLFLSFSQLPSGVTYLNLVGIFHNYRLGYLLPRYGPMVLGRRVKTGLTATHLKSAYVQTKAHSQKPWSHAYGRGNCYKIVMASRCNMTIIKKEYAYCQSEHKKY